MHTYKHVYIHTYICTICTYILYSISARTNLVLRALCCWNQARIPWINCDVTQTMLVIHPQLKLLDNSFTSACSKEMNILETTHTSWRLPTCISADIRAGSMEIGRMSVSRCFLYLRECFLSRHAYYWCINQRCDDYRPLIPCMYYLLTLRPMEEFISKPHPLNESVPIKWIVKAMRQCYQVQVNASFL